MLLRRPYSGLTYCSFTLVSPSDFLKCCDLKFAVSTWVWECASLPKLSHLSVRMCFSPQAVTPKCESKGHLHLPKSGEALLSTSETWGVQDRRLGQENPPRVGACCPHGLESLHCDHRQLVASAVRGRTQPSERGCWCVSDFAHQKHNVASQQPTSPWPCQHRKQAPYHFLQEPLRQSLLVWRESILGNPP